MASFLSTHELMGSVQTVSGNTPFTKALAEAATQTFKQGTPVMLALTGPTTGYIQAWDGTTGIAGTPGIAGITLIPAAGLATNGKGTPTSFGQPGPPAAIQTYGTVPYQPSAFNIAYGTPVTDGRTLFECANQDTIFEGQFDNNTYTNAASITILQTQIGTQFGLTIDANGTWYVDNGKTTPGTNTVVTVIGVNPLDESASVPNTYIPNARVRFVFLPAVTQVLS